MIVALDYTIKRNPDPVSGMQRDVECTDGDTDGKLCLRAPRRATKKLLCEETIAEVNVRYEWGPRLTRRNKPAPSRATETPRYHV